MEVGTVDTGMGSSVAAPRPEEEDVARSSRVGILGLAKVLGAASALALPK